MHVDAFFIMFLSFQRAAVLSLGRNLGGHPGPEGEGERVRDAELRRVAAPERREVDVEADLAAAVPL